MTVGDRRALAMFVVVNVLNTLLYYGLYLLFLQVTDYGWANVLALSVAVLLAYAMNARYAFQVEMSGSSLAKFVVTNLTTMALRTGAVWLLVEFLATDERIAPLVAVVLTLPFAYLSTKFVMVGGRAGRGERQRAPRTAPVAGSVARIAS